MNEAPADCDIGMLERELDVAGGLDEGADVGVQHLQQAAAATDLVDQGQTLTDDGHPRRIERHGPRPGIVLDDGGDEADGAATGEEVGHLHGAAP